MATKSLITESIYKHYLGGLLTGDRQLCGSVVTECRDRQAELQDIYVNLFQRSLYQVGDSWEQHQISVAVEHLATAITERLMTTLQPQVFSGATREHSIIVACVADEYHQLGGRMVADVAEMHCWRGHFLGANTPLEELLKMVDERRPNLLALSLSVYFNLPAMIRALDAVTGAFPNLPVLVGGQAFRPRWGGTAGIQKYSGVILAATLKEAEEILAAHERI